MSIACEHCSHLRRAEGGLKIGGRVGLATVPPCPCASMKRYSDVESPQFDNGMVASVYSRYYAFCDLPRRFCTSNGEIVIPNILNLHCINYDDGDLSVGVNIRFYPGIPFSCTYQEFVEIGSCGWASGGYTDSNPFVPNNVPGQFTWARAIIYAQYLAGEFVADPIFNMEFELSRV